MRNPQKGLFSTLFAPLVVALSVSFVAPMSRGQPPAAARNDLPDQIGYELNAPDSLVSSTQLAELCKRDPKLAVPLLISACAGPSLASKRIKAVSALGILARTDPEVTVPLLLSALHDSNVSISTSAADALAIADPGKHIPDLIKALKGTIDAADRRDAAETLAFIGPPAHQAVPSIVSLLQDPEPVVRIQAAQALERIHASPEIAIPALINRVEQDSDARVRRACAFVLMSWKEESPQVAVSANVALLGDQDAKSREAAARNLGMLGLRAKLVLPTLVEALRHDTISGAPSVEQSAVASAIVQITDAIRDGQQADSIDELLKAAQALEKYFPREAGRVRASAKLLQAIRPPWYEVLALKLHEHHWISIAAAGYFLAILICLGLLWRYPLWLLRINEIPLFSRRVTLPGWMGSGDASLGHLLVFGFFHYHPRVLDTWVSRHTTIAEGRFGTIRTVEQREFYVEVPVQLDGKIIPGLRSEDLMRSFDRKRVCLVISGEGGSGKTSMACQIAKWVMSNKDAMRPCVQRMLPVMIEQDLDFDVSKEKVVFTEAVRGQLRNLTGETEAPTEEFVGHLLRRQRVLVIVDGLSEMSQVTRNKIRPADPEFGANALLVTSRLEESMDGVTTTMLHPVRVRGNRLSSFMDAYLVQRGKRTLFEDPEFFAACSKLSMMIGDRDITVLLVKLYADQMIASKERTRDRLPETIPDLMLEYLNELNRKEPGFDDRVVHAAAKVTAWECLRQAYRPMPAKIDAVLAALGGGAVAEIRLKYLEQKVGLIQTIGAGRDHIKFALDPLSEYLAGLYAVEHYRDNERLWQEFLAKADSTPGGPELINSFLLAVRDCCVAKGPEASLSPWVAEELTHRIRLDPVMSRAAAEST